MKQEYLNYFNETLNRIKHSVNVNIPIIPYDHDKIKGHKEALGICHGTCNQDKSGWIAEEITIDEYFIEECYEAEINGKWYMMDFLSGTNLVGVICHEIAHIYELRHGKKHTALTNHLIRLVEEGEPHGIKFLSA